MKNQNNLKNIKCSKECLGPASNGVNKKIIASFLSFSVLAIPFVASAQVVAPCNGPDCGFDDLITLGNNIVSFLMIDVAVPLAALGFMFMGAKLVLFSNKETAKTEAKEGLWNIAIGFAIMLGSYVLIKVILYSFLNTDEGFTLFLLQ